MDDEGSAIPELVVMVGLQGSGKSTYVARVLAKDHEVVSKDHWPRARHREQRQLRITEQHLQDRRSVVVDNTNASIERRAGLVALAHRLGVPVRAVFVSTPFELCEQRNAGRTGRARVPDVGLRATAKVLVPPTIAEGFDRVEVVRGSADPPASPASGGGPRWWERFLRRASVVRRGTSRCLRCR